MIYVAWVQDHSLLYESCIDYAMPNEVIGEYDTVEEATESINRYMVLVKERFHRVWDLCGLDINYAMKHYPEIGSIKDFKRRFLNAQDPDEEFLDELIKLDNFWNFKGRCHTNVCDKEDLKDFEGPIVWKTDWE